MAAFAIPLAGCQRFQPAPISIDDSAAVLEARSFADTGLKDFLEKSTGRELAQWPMRTWDFDALTLAAFYFHPSLDLARAQWSVAEAGVITAGGRPNPNITLAPEYSFNPDRGVSPWLPLVSFSVPIETAGKRGHRIAHAKGLSAAARLNIVTTAWQVRSRVRAALLDRHAARQRETVLRQQFALQQRIVAQLENRVRAGTISSFEAATARINLARAQADLEDLRTRTSEASARLAEAIGIPASVVSDIDIVFKPPTPAPEQLASADLRHEALYSRADIRASLAEYAASQSALQLEIAKQYPDVQLGSGYQWDQGEHKWSLSLTMDLPVLNQNQGPIAEAKAKRTEAAARFDAAQAKALAEIDLASASFRGAQTNLAILESLLAQQQRQRAAIEAQFKAGAADQLELLNAEAELATAELLRTDAQTKAAAAAGQLEDAIQRPFDALTHVEESPRMLTDADQRHP